MNSTPGRSIQALATERRQETFWTAWAVCAAFGSYFCMYAFRKPFTAASFADVTLWGIGFKTILVTSQVAGYAISKFVGIRVVAEMRPRYRAVGVFFLVLVAETALVLFGAVPRPWNAICLFLNGLPLGIVFGLVMGCLEGRRLTELMTAGLCASFILADGVTKSTGAWLLTQGVAEDWMPSVAGALYFVPFTISVAMLAVIPPPSQRDIVARTERFAMNGIERRNFFVRYASGLIPLVTMYLAVTIVRCIRADFSPEIWQGLGRNAAPSTFAYSEMYVAFGALVINGSAVLIADNRRAFFFSLATCGIGFCLLAAALLGIQAELVNDFTFMVLLGLGLYVPYVAMNTTVFERLLSMTRDRGNIGFLMYVADSIGYLGYVIVMVLRNFWPAADDLLSLLILACWITIGVSATCLWQAARFFRGIALTAAEPISRDPTV